MKLVALVGFTQQVLILLNTSCASFVIQSRNIRSHAVNTRWNLSPKPPNRICYTSVHSKPEEYDDGIGDVGDQGNNDLGEKDGQFADGESLAKDFYKNLQQRRYEEQSSLPSSLSNEVTNISNPDDAFSFPPRKAEVGSLFDTNEYYQSQEDQPPQPKRKFTGRTQDNSYFGGSQNTRSGNRDVDGTVRDRMMRREYDLVSGATGRTALGLQAGIALSMLVFFIYVGLSGGIVSGDAALDMDFGGDDFIQFEEIIPVPRDTNDSVWI